MIKWIKKETKEHRIDFLSHEELLSNKLTSNKLLSNKYASYYIYNILCFVEFYYIKFMKMWK